MPSETPLVPCQRAATSCAATDWYCDQYLVMKVCNEVEFSREEGIVRGSGARCSMVQQRVCVSQLVRVGVVLWYKSMRGACRGHHSITKARFVGRLEPPTHLRVLAPRRLPACNSLQACPPSRQPSVRRAQDTGSTTRLIHALLDTCAVASCSATGCKEGTMLGGPPLHADGQSPKRGARAAAVPWPPSAATTCMPAEAAPPPGLATRLQTVPPTPPPTCALAASSCAARRRSASVAASSALRASHCASTACRLSSSACLARSRPSRMARVGPSAGCLQQARRPISAHSGGDSSVWAHPAGICGQRRGRCCPGHAAMTNASHLLLHVSGFRNAGSFKAGPVHPRPLAAPPPTPPHGCVRTWPPLPRRRRQCPALRTAPPAWPACRAARAPRTARQSRPRC